jgi:hypothetical protein
MTVPATARGKECLMWDEGVITDEDFKVKKQQSLGL